MLFSPMAEYVKNYRIKSFNVIAHIRKATQGEVNIENTHPLFVKFGEKTGFLSS